MKWEQIRVPGAPKLINVKPSDRPRHLPMWALSAILILLIGGLGMGAALTWRKPAPMQPLARPSAPAALPAPGAKEYRTPNAIIRFEAAEEQR